MKTLYAHGMHSKPKTWRIEAIKSLGLEPYTLHFPYYNYTTEEKFIFFKKYIRDNQIEFLVGHSHGGYMVYYLAEMLGLPCLCFNPQLSLKTAKYITPKIEKRKCPLCLIMLGEDDRLVYAQRTLTFLEKEKKHNSNKIVKTQIFDGIGHGIDPEIFTDMLIWSLEEIKNIQF